MKDKVIKVKGMTLTILGKEITLTIEQAKELQQELNRVFNQPAYSGWWYTNGSTSEIKAPITTVSTYGNSTGTYVSDGDMCTPTVSLDFNPIDPETDEGEGDEDEVLVGV